jgi:hypothetical protein
LASAGLADASFWSWLAAKCKHPVSHTGNGYKLHLHGICEHLISPNIVKSIKTKANRFITQSCFVKTVIGE